MAVVAPEESVAVTGKVSVPVAVGVSASGTHLATAFARMAREHGADALMVAPPTGLKNLDAVLEYYRTVAAATPLPIVLQDEPVTTQVNMPAPFIAQVCADLPAIQAVKLEEPPTLPKITRPKQVRTLLEALEPFPGARIEIMIARAYNQSCNVCDPLKIFANNERLCPKINIGRDIERVEYVAVTDKDAVAAFKLCTKLEGIMPALEPSHAIHQAGVIA